jgi:hypothetical protein
MKKKTDRAVLVGEAPVVSFNPNTPNNVNNSRIYQMLHHFTIDSSTAHKKRLNGWEVKNVISALHEPKPKLPSNSASEENVEGSLFRLLAETTDWHNYTTSLLEIILSREFIM